MIGIHQPGTAKVFTASIEGEIFNTIICYEFHGKYQEFSVTHKKQHIVIFGINSAIEKIAVFWGSIKCPRRAIHLA